MQTFCKEGCSAVYTKRCEADREYAGIALPFWCHGCAYAVKVRRLCRCCPPCEACLAAPIDASVACRLQTAARTVAEAVSSAGVFASPKAAAYWGYHLSRSSFFMIQGIAGVAPAALGKGDTVGMVRAWRALGVRLAGLVVVG